MEKLILNETPVRTSVNFGINDIVLKDFEMPNLPAKFENISIKKENAQVNQNAIINNSKLTYGVGLEEQIEKQSNQSIQIKFENSKKETVEIEYGFNETNNCLIDNIEILAKENSKGTVILKYKSEKNEKSYHNGICRIKLEKNSNINVIIVNLLGSEADNFLSIESSLSESAKLGFIMVDLGGNRRITNYYSNLEGKMSENTIDSIYLGEKEQLIDINYIAHLRGEKTNVNIEVQGALKDKAQKHFKGTIDFKTGAKKAKGNENEFCMLLSENAKSKALPMLLCTEEDVEGNHSSASGRINKNELFYLMSRGFSEKEAMKLLVKAKLTPIIEKIEKQELKQEILSQIDKI